MARGLPKTLAGQMILMLILVLMLAQGANILLLVGEQRLNDIAGRNARAVDAMVDASRSLPNKFRYPLPFPIKRGRAGGGFFVSTLNRAEITTNSGRLPDLEEQLKSAFIKEGLEIISVHAVWREITGPPQLIPPPGATSFPTRPFHPMRPPAPRRSPPPGLEELTISVEIKPGIYLNALIPYHPAGAQTIRLLLATGLLFFTTLIVVWFSLRRITRPLNNLASAADQLGRGGKTDRLPETGPKEVRLAARAFNQMQDRMMRLFETQRTMLRAVGHDLRTPLTSLRIRAENISSEEERDRIIETLDEMTAITEEVLDWAKDATAGEDPVSVDLDALLSSIADNYVDQGEIVEYRAIAPVILECRRIALKRALRNLIDNALKYGKQSRIQLIIKENMIIILIDDIGPGIPEEEFTEVMKPFVRLEKSRNKETGGRGLGLSLALAVIEAHGGHLILENLKPSGLRAKIYLPRRLH